MNLDQTIYGTFSASEAASASGVSVESIQTWLKRKLIVGHRNIEGGGSQGRHRRFTFNNVMEIAVAKAIIDMGVSTKQAFTASNSFAHTGGGGEVFSLPDRQPSLPFHHNHGDTIMGIAGLRSFEELYKSGEDYDTFGRLRHHLQSEHFLALNVSEIFGHVCVRMNLHSRKVLDAVYPESVTD